MQVHRILLALLLSASFTAQAMAIPTVTGGGGQTAASGNDKVELGYKQLKQGLAEQAIASFTLALRVNPGNVRAQLGLGMAQQKAGRTAKAIVEYDKTLKLDPANVDALRELGRLYSYQETTWPLAIDVLQKYTAAQPGDNELLLILANVQGWSGDHKTAERNVRTVLAQQPGNTNAKLFLAQVLTWQGHGREAMPIFNELIAAGQLPRSARHDYALALRQNGNYNEAEKLYTQLIAEQPNSAKLKSELSDLITEKAGATQQTLSQGSYSKEQLVLLDQARSYHQQQRTEEAIPIYRRVLSQRAGDEKLTLEFIDILASVPAYRQEALSKIDEEYKKHPSRQLQLERAKVLSWIPERRMEAFNVFREYYRQNPSDEDIRKQLTQVLGWLDTDSSLIPQYNEMLQFDPTNETLRLRLAQALLTEKNYPTAVSHLETLLRANPDNFDARLALAGAYLGAGRIEDSEAQLRLLLQLDPSNVDVLAGLAGIAAKSGDFERAAQMFNRVLKVSPNNTLSLVGLADSYLGQGKQLQAIPLLRQAFDQTRDEKIGYELAELYQKLGQFDKAEKIIKQIQPRSDGTQTPPASRVPTVPPPTNRRANQSPNLEPGAANPSTAPTGQTSTQPLPVNGPSQNAAQPDSKSQSNTPSSPVKLQSYVGNAANPPLEPTITADKPATKLNRLYMQDPDDIKNQIDSETASTLRFQYMVLSRSGEETAAFAGTPDAISTSALLTNKITLSYDFNLGRQLRIGIDAEPTFLSTGAQMLLGTNQTLPGTAAFGKDGLAGRVRFVYQPEERVRLSGNAGITPVGDAVGGVNLAFQATDKVQLLLEASRDPITESLLSFVGFDQLGGEGKIGRVRATGGGGGLSFRFDPRTDMTIHYRHDSYSEQGLPNNTRNLVDIGVGRDVSDHFGDWKLSGLDYFRIGYQFTYFGFANDQSTISTDGGDAFGELLVRGYFSPASFISNGVRVDVAGTYKKKLDYRFAGGLGIQVARSVSSRFLEPGTNAGALAYVNLMYHFTEHFAWGAEYEFNNSGSNYSSNRLGTTVIYKF